MIAALPSSFLMLIILIDSYLGRTCHGARPLATAQPLFPGQAIWSNGSRSENGRCGAGLTWQEPGGAWKALSRNMNTRPPYRMFGYFDLFGVGHALSVSQTPRTH